MRRGLAVACLWGVVLGLTVIGAEIAVVGALQRAHRFVRRAYPLVLALFLAGCPRPPIAPLERDAFAAAELGWERAGLGAPGDCLRGARVHHAATRDEFRERCYGLSESVMRGATECLARYGRGVMDRRGGWLVLITPGSRTYERDTRHGALHALMRCRHDRACESNRADEVAACRAGRMDPFDGNHSDPRVWGDNRPGSAEQLAGEAYHAE